MLLQFQAFLNFCLYANGNSETRQCIIDIKFKSIVTSKIALLKNNYLQFIRKISTSPTGETRLTITKII